jgi:hypothetical protein
VPVPYTDQRFALLGSGTERYVEHTLGIGVHVVIDATTEAWCAIGFHTRELYRPHYHIKVFDPRLIKLDSMTLHPLVSDARALVTTDRRRSKSISGNGPRLNLSLNRTVPLWATKSASWKTSVFSVN